MTTTYYYTSRERPLLHQHRETLITLAERNQAFPRFWVECVLSVVWGSLGKPWLEIIALCLLHNFRKHSQH